MMHDHARRDDPFGEAILAKAAPALDELGATMFPFDRFIKLFRESFRHNDPNKKQRTRPFMALALCRSE